MFDRKSSPEASQSDPDDPRCGWRIRSLGLDPVRSSAGRHWRVCSQGQGFRRPGAVTSGHEARIKVANSQQPDSQHQVLRGVARFWWQRCDDSHDDGFVHNDVENSRRWVVINDVVTPTKNLACTFVTCLFGCRSHGRFCAYIPPILVSVKTVTNLCPREPLLWSTDYNTVFRSTLLTLG